MGSKIGITKVAAGRLGLILEDYQKKLVQGQKWCWKCRRWKSTKEFTVDHSRGDGLSATCYDCRRSKNRIGPSKRERREMRNQGLTWCCSCKQWFSTGEIRNARCRPCRNAYARERYAIDQKYREERKNYRDKHRRGIERVPFQAQEMLLEYTDERCVYCGSPATTWDHIVPVSKGGETTPGNIVPCCCSCNSSKRDKDVLEWINKKGLEPLPMLWERMELSAME